MLKFRDLGTLEIRTADRLYFLRGSLQTTLMTALLASGQCPVSVDALIRELWGDGRPADAENAAHAHISRLRKSLGRLEPGRSQSRLSVRSSQYRLSLEPGDQVDADVFVRTVSELDDAADVPARDRVARLRAALGMWRGRVLGGVTGGPICQAAAARIERSRLRAYEMLFDAELECGNHNGIVPELSALISEGSPFEECYCEQLLIALYRSGRHADALDLYRRTWGRVVNKIGGPTSLGFYERAILRHDPILHTRHVRRDLARASSAS